jgi:hypothetical protein
MKTYFALKNLQSAKIYYNDKKITALLSGQDFRTNAIRRLFHEL